MLGKVPTISIDKTDGCQMYLNNESLGVELITSKSSEMNVMVPVRNGEDYVSYMKFFSAVILKLELFLNLTQRINSNGVEAFWSDKCFKLFWYWILDLKQLKD